MSEIRERLTKLIKQEQELRGYSTSSPWSNALRPAISYLELSETAANPAEKFRNAWSALYNLWMMMHQRGEIENLTFLRFIAEVETAPAVRSIALGTPSSFLEALKKTQTTLLFNAESKKPRDAKQRVELWLDRRNKRRDDLSAEKACNYLFIIGRDIRNALSHPTLDPNKAIIKKALTEAAAIFLPLAVAATKAIIERPPEGTTGRVVAYRSFLYPFIKNSDSPFSDYYLERLFPEQELSAFPEDEAKNALKEITKELTTRRRDLVRADAEETVQRWCDPVLFQKLGFSSERGVKIVTDDGVFEPTAVLKKGDIRRLLEEYKGKEAGRDLACLIWVLPWSTSLDAVSDDEESSGKTVMEIAQSALTRADVDWAMLTNGQKVRLLSKTTAHKPRSFMEIDVGAIAEQWVEREAQLAFRYLLGLWSGSSIIEKDSQDCTRLERALRESERHGKEISDELKKNVFSALEELGEGFLAYMRSKPAELDEWRSQRAPSLSTEAFLKSEELLTDIYHESLSLMYRLLFLFYAEGRDLLPMDDETYRDSYSLESIRDDIIATHDDPDPKSFFSPGSYELWGRLTELFKAVDGGWQNIIPAYNGGLFDPEQHPFLETFKNNDQQLARGIDLLSRTRPGAVRGEGRKKVTYRDLDIRHLGSIYEGILEYHAEIADEEKVSVKRGSGGKAAEEYLAPSELTANEKKHLKAYRDAVNEDEENPALPRGCKVTGLVGPGEYYLIYGGRESKRKSSGSYYTPDYIVQYIVENTLGPLVRGECRPKPEPVPELLKGTRGFEEAEDIRPLSADEILELKVLDPAMGSGHFLVAATEYLARAYGAACIREGKDRDGMMSDEDFVHYKRIIAERCIYGVDINPMAVELAKLSMWLFTMDKGRPLSFLNHHLKCGNALVGAWIEDLGSQPGDARTRRQRVGDTEIDADKMKKWGFDPTSVVDRHAYKTKFASGKQANVFEDELKRKLPLMIRDLFGITERETLTIKDVEAKKSLDNAIDQLKTPFRNLADVWVGIHFGEPGEDYTALLSQFGLWQSRNSPIARERNAFHWQLEFPEVFFDEYGRSKDNSGFDVSIGNPPYKREKDAKDLFDLLKPSPIGRVYYRGKMDYWYFFTHVALKLVRRGGRNSFITTSYWTQADGATILRSEMQSMSYLHLLVDFAKFQIFEESAGQYAIYFLETNNPGGSASLFQLQEPYPSAAQIASALAADDLERYFSKIDRPSLFDSRGEITLSSHEDLVATPGDWISVNKADVDVGEGITPGPETLSARSAKRTAVAEGLNLAVHLETHQIAIGDGVFVCEKDKFSNLPLTTTERKILVPFVEQNHLVPFADLGVSQTNKSMIYSSPQTVDDEREIPALIAHLEKYKFVMLQRRETRQGRREWFHLHWPRNRRYVYGPKVLIPRMVQLPFACFSESDCAVGESILCLPVHNKLARNFWLGYLNSKPIQDYLSRGKRRGIGVDISVKLFNSIPLPVSINTELTNIQNVRTGYKLEASSPIKQIIEITEEIVRYDQLTESKFIEIRKGGSTVDMDLLRLIFTLDAAVSDLLFPTAASSE